MLKVPLFYFSPKVAFLDDNRIFLQTLKKYFVQEYEVFIADRIDCFLKKVEDSDIRIDLLKLIDQEDDYLSEGVVVSIDFMDLKTKVLNLVEEKQPVSVAFIDFDMPEQDGLEVCKKIKDLSLKKALLTGELAETGAVNAFNNGLINGYIHKNSCSMIEQIKSTIQKLHNDYLIALSSIYAPFITKNAHVMDLYNTTSFEKLFKKLLQENNIAKGCIYEMSGSQILKDKNSIVFYPLLNRKLPVFF